MARIEKTVFISYRRADESWALAVFENLTQHGYDVFIDYDGIASGSFATAILENIKARAHFLVLLTPTALERCGDPKDWMRREIEAALDSQRNIVPLMLAGFDFGKPPVAGQLTGKLAALKEYNGLEIPKGYFSPAMERLRNKFLSVSLDTVLHPASLSAQRAATEQKDKATMALGEALRQPWLSPEPRKQEETAAQQRVEEERRRQQEEPRTRAEEERRREETETKRRLDEAEAEKSRQDEEARRLEKEAELAAKKEQRRKILKKPWLWKAAAVAALLLLGWIGLFATGIPISRPGAVRPDTPEQTKNEKLAAAKSEGAKTDVRDSTVDVRNTTIIIPTGPTGVEGCEVCHTGKQIMADGTVPPPKTAQQLLDHVQKITASMKHAVDIIQGRIKSNQSQADETKVRLGYAQANLRGLDGSRVHDFRVTPNGVVGHFGRNGECLRLANLWAELACRDPSAHCAGLIYNPIRGGTDHRSQSAHVPYDGTKLKIKTLGERKRGRGHAPLVGSQDHS